MGRKTRNASSEDFDSDDEYFARTYRPLSNLPTPPPSTRNSSAFQSPQSMVGDGEALESTFLGPAVHLVNLLPPAASLATPSVSLVQAILTRANLPMDTIALAVCILDSLDSKFSRRWRLSCPLARLELAVPVGSSKRHTLPANPAVVSQQLHIDSVLPELIALSALVIAVKFTEDLQEPTQYYCSRWGRGIWSCEQLNFTERCIMESLNYRIMPLMDKELLADVRDDMRRAGLYAAKQQKAAAAALESSARDGAGPPPHLRSMSTGVAVTGLGLQLTPADSPGADGVCCDLGVLAEETQAAFQRQPSVLSRESLHLPDDGRRRCPPASMQQFDEPGVV